MTEQPATITHTVDGAGIQQAARIGSLVLSLLTLAFLGAFTRE